MKTKKIFVVGPGRSGTTLLRTLIDNHEEILLWPFEFNYYNRIYHLLRDDKKKYSINEYYFYLKDDLNNFNDLYKGDLGDTEYKVINFDYSKFLKYFVDNKIEYTPKEFLIYLEEKYYECLEQKPKQPKYFVIFHNDPSKYLLNDFPDANFIFCLRNPIDLYISTKKYYFKACELTGRDPSCVYRGYSANSQFNTLMEASIIPIIYCDYWISSTYIRSKFVIKLEDLRNDPIKLIDDLCGFLDIKVTKSLFKTTFMGQKHYSNLSNEKNPNSEIIKSYKNFNINKELSKFEIYWLNNILCNRKIFSVYNIKSDKVKINILSLFVTLKFELPNYFKESNKSNFTKYLIRILLRYCFFPYNYINNRLVLFFSNYYNLLKKWPTK